MTSVVKLCLLLDPVCSFNHLNNILATIFIPYHPHASHLQTIIPCHALLSPLLNPLLRLFLRLLNPSLITPVLNLFPNHTLQRLARKAQEIMPSQRILPHPLRPLPPLSNQRLLIPNLPRTDPRILNHGDKIKPDLTHRKSLHALLHHRNNLVRELIKSARTMRYRCGVQPVEFVERAVDGRVRDEVIEVVVLGRHALLLAYKGAAARERVVRLADEFAVAEALAAEVRGHEAGEVFEFFERGADVDFVVLVQEHGEQRLGAAGVLDGLRGEEDLFCGGGVGRAVGGDFGLFLCVVAGQVFEEEDQAVYWA